MAKKWPKGFQVVAVVPAWNEAESIKQVVEELRECKRQGLLAEIVVVSDGSTDKTAELAKKAGADKVITLKENQGKAMAYAKAVEYFSNKYALRQNFKTADRWMQKMDKTIVVSIDADIKNIKPEHIAKLVKPLLKLPSKEKTRRKWVNMVIGTRVRSGELLSYSPFNGERAIRLRSLQALKRNKKKWDAICSTGYGLETALNTFIPKAEFANAKFTLGRKAEAKHKPGYIGKDLRIIESYLETRKQIATRLRNVKRNIKEKKSKREWLYHMRMQEKQARELAKLKSQNQRKKRR